MGLLDGKVAIITGSGNGIGRATALAFAREGAQVVVNDLGCARDGSGHDAEVASQVVEEIRAASGRAVSSAHDVSTRDGAQALVALSVSQFGGLDILVNNAGVLRDRPLSKVEDSDWEAVIGTCLRGTFYCVQAAAARMRATGGRIVNTTGLAGLQGNFSQMATAAAQGGVYGLTRTASIELQRFGITVNAVAPMAKTRMTEDLPMFEKLETLTPEHVVPAHLFFSSDLAGERTGNVLAVAGGKMSLYKLAETAGRFKESDAGLWTPQEIAEHWRSLSKA